MTNNPLAGKPAQPSMLVDVPKLIDAYYSQTPDVSLPSQRVAFGTSGHRGSSLERSFNEKHILAITQAICLYRRQQGVDGPLFLGADTHALSEPAGRSALEVLAANGVEVMIAAGDEYTPTPAVSHAILSYNRGRADRHLADGIVITPSHNPPDRRRLQVQPAATAVRPTPMSPRWIEARGQRVAEGRALRGVKRMPLRACAARRRPRIATTISTAYVDDLRQVIDMDAIRARRLESGRGSAGRRRRALLAAHRRALRPESDRGQHPGRPDVPLHDARLGRPDPHGPSSPYAMQRLIGLKDRFDIAFACDTDHDRHGIVTRSAGLLPPNHYLAVAIDYCSATGRSGGATAAVGKTVVSSSMIDRVAGELGSGKLCEVPVGFKWFVDGLLDGSLGFGGEESAGRVLPAPGRHRLDHRQGRHHRRRCWRRRSRRGPAAIRASSTSDLTRELRRAGCTTASMRRPMRQQKARLGKLSPAAGAPLPSWPARRSSRC